MKFERYISNASNVFAQNRLLKLVVIVLVVLVMFSFAKITELSGNQKVILVPAGLSDKVEIGSSQADETYLSAMGVYAATLMYSTTAVSVETQYKLLTELFDTAAYTKYSESLMTTAAAQAKNAVSFSLKIDQIQIETSPKQEIRMSVSIEKYIFGQKSDAVPERRELVVGFKLSNGRFYITTLEEEKLL